MPLERRPLVDRSRRQSPQSLRGMRVSRTVGLGLLLAVAFASLAAAPTPVMKPNLVLVTLDTTRADHLGCYGARGARTPILDSLAAKGTRYARAIAASPLT